MSRGFALVSALFLLVVLSILGAYLVGVVAVQHSTPLLRLRGSRAEYAARAGLGWAVRRAVEDKACPNDSFTSPDEEYRIDVACSVSLHAADGGPMNYYVIEVTASAGVFGTPEFVSRRLRAKVAGPA